MDSARFELAISSLQGKRPTTELRAHLINNYCKEIYINIFNKKNYLQKITNNEKL